MTNTHKKQTDAKKAAQEAAKDAQGAALVSLVATSAAIDAASDSQGAALVSAICASIAEDAASEAKDAANDVRSVIKKQDKRDDQQDKRDDRQDKKLNKQNTRNDKQDRQLENVKGNLAQINECLGNQYGAIIENTQADEKRYKELNNRMLNVTKKVHDELENVNDELGNVNNELGNVNDELGEIHDRFHLEEHHEQEQTYEINHTEKLLKKLFLNFAMERISSEEKINKLLKTNELLSSAIRNLLNLGSETNNTVKANAEPVIEHKMKRYTFEITNNKGHTIFDGLIVVQNGKVIHLLDSNVICFDENYNYDAMEHTNGVDLIADNAYPLNENGVNFRSTRLQKALKSNGCHFNIYKNNENKYELYDNNYLNKDDYNIKINKSEYGHVDDIFTPGDFPPGLLPTDSCY